MLGLQEYNGKSVPVEGVVVTSLVPFHTQGCRESCPEGCERVLILGGLCPAMPTAANTDCPFMEPLKEFPVWGHCVSSWEHP